MAIRNVLDIDFALQMHMQVTPDDINYREFHLLRALAEARNDYQDERIKKSSSNGGQ